MSRAGVRRKKEAAEVGGGLQSQM